MQGDKLNEITNPTTAYSRIKELEREGRRSKAAQYSGPPIVGTDPTTTKVAIVSVEDVTALAVPAYDGGGNYRPYINIVIGGDYSQVIRSFVGYSVRIIPANGEVFTVDGPSFPDAGSPFAIRNLTTPPSAEEVWQAQVRIRTALYGTGLWSDFVPITWGGDTTAPPPPDFAVVPFPVNYYDPRQHITNFRVAWRAMDPTILDFDRFVLEYRYSSGVWVRVDTFTPEVLFRDFAGIFIPGSTVQFRLLAQDTSGNQSAWTNSVTVAVATEPQATAPTGVHLDNNHAEGLNIYRTNLRWTDSTDTNTTSYHAKYWYTDEESVIITEISLGGTYTVHGLSEGNTHWRMRSVSAYGQPGPWTDPVEWYISGVALDPPTDVAIMHEWYDEESGMSGFVLFWLAVLNATGYIVNLTENGVLHRDTVGAGLYRRIVYPGAAINAVVYSTDGYGNISTGSTPLNFTAQRSANTAGVRNGSFELPKGITTEAEDWNHYDGSGSASYTRSTVYAQQGIASARAVVQHGTAFGGIESVKFVLGAATNWWTTSFYARLDPSLTYTDTINVSAVWTPFDINGTQLDDIVSVPVTINQSGWSHVTFVNTHALPNAYYARIRIYIHKDGGGYLTDDTVAFIDNVVCTRLVDRDLLAEKTVENSHLSPTFKANTRPLFPEIGDVLINTGSNQVEKWDGTVWQRMGSDGDKTYIHSQSASSTVWTVVHNLNKYPVIQVIDSAGTWVEGDPHYLDLNQLTLTFSTAFSGSVSCN